MLFAASAPTAALSPAFLRTALGTPAAALSAASASAATAAGVSSGSPLRRVAILGLALVAALSLSRARRHKAYAHHAMRGGARERASGGEARNFFSFPPLLYVGLAGASMLWASDPSITSRRIVVFLLIVFAAWAFAQAWTIRDLLYFLLWANATSLVLGLGGSIARGQFHPAAAGWRFTGFANPNLHGIEAACLYHRVCGRHGRAAARAADCAAHVRGRDAAAHEVAYGSGESAAGGRILRGLVDQAQQARRHWRAGRRDRVRGGGIRPDS